MIFIIDIFQKIFKQTDGDYSTEINKDLLLPFIIISIEAKNGHTKEELENSLPYIQSLSSLLSQGKIDIDTSNKMSDTEKQTVNTQEVYEKSLKTKYEKYNGNIVLYSELYDLVFDGYISDEKIKGIVDSIRNQYKQREETEEQKLLKKIVNWSQISDEDFLDVVNKVKQAVENNKFSVYDILRIYASFIQIEFMKIEKFEVTKEDSQKFKTAIDSTMNDQQYDPLFSVHCTMWDDYDRSDAKDRYNEMRNYAIETNQKLKSKSNSNQRNEVIDMIENNKTDDFIKFMSEFNNKSLFVEIEIQDLTNALATANTDIRRIFYYGIATFFIENLVNPSQEDVNYLEKLKSALNEYIDKEQKRKNSLVYLLYTQNYIEGVLKKYNAILSR